MEIVVGVGDMKVSNDPEIVLATYSLGSCIGLTIFDPLSKVGGILHYMLPESKIDSVKAKKIHICLETLEYPFCLKNHINWEQIRTDLRSR